MRNVLGGLIIAGLTAGCMPVNFTASVSNRDIYAKAIAARVACDLKSSFPAMAQRLPELRTWAVGYRISFIDRKDAGVSAGGMPNPGRLHAATEKRVVPLDQLHKVTCPAGQRAGDALHIFTPLKEAMAASRKAKPPVAAHEIAYRVDVGVRITPGSGNPGFAIQRVPDERPAPMAGGERAYAVELAFVDMASGVPVSAATQARIGKALQQLRPDIRAP